MNPGLKSKTRNRYRARFVEKIKSAIGSFVNVPALFPKIALGDGLKNSKYLKRDIFSLELASVKKHHVYGLNSKPNFFYTPIFESLRLL